MNDVLEDTELDQVASSSQRSSPMDDTHQQISLFPPPPPPLVLDMNDYQGQCSSSSPPPPPPPPPHLLDMNDYEGQCSSPSPPSPPPSQVSATKDGSLHSDLFSFSPCPPPNPQQGYRPDNAGHQPDYRHFNAPPSYSQSVTDDAHKEPDYQSLSSSSSNMLEMDTLEQSWHQGPFRNPLQSSLTPKKQGFRAVDFQRLPPGTMITQNQIVSENVTLAGGVKVDNKEMTNMQAQMYELLKKACTPFVETTGYSKAKACLDSRGHVTLIGEAGSGKTTIGYGLLKFYKDSKTFTPLIVDDASELKRLRDRKEPTLVFINDVFGRSAYSATKLEMWLPVFEQLHRTLNRDKFRIIFSSRNYIFKEAQPDLVLYYNNLFSENTQIDLSGDATLLQSEKEKLLRVFAKRGGISITDEEVKYIVQMKTTYGFPHACYLFCEMKMWHNQPVEFFSKPVDVFIESVQHLSRYDKNKFAVLLLVLLGDGKLSLAKLRKEADVPTVIQGYTKSISEFVSQRHEIISPLIGSYLTSVRDSVKFRHPTVEDAVAFVAGTRDPLFLIEQCSMRVLYERVKIYHSSGQGSTEPTQPNTQWFHVVISDDYHADLITRFVAEIQKRNFPLVCLHQACSVKRFVDALFVALRDVVQCERLFHNKDVEHKQNMLYWCVMNRSPILFNKMIGKSSYRPYEEHNALIACCITGNAAALQAALNAMTLESKQRLFNMSITRKNMAIRLDEDINSFKNHEIYDDRLLNIASRHGHKDVVKVLVQAGCSVGGSKNVTPPLHSCCEGGHVDVLSYLHDEGADLEAKMFDGKTPLHACCVSGHLPAVEKCIELGAVVESSDTDGMTPLLAACRNGYEHIAERLTKHGASMEDRLGRDTLYYACQGGCEDIVEEILKDQRCKALSSYGRGITLLHGVARKSRVGREDKKYAIAKQLIDLGCDVNAADEDGMTPLLIAAESGYVEIANLLITNGASPSVKNINSQTILHKAAHGGLLDKVNFLSRDSAPAGKVVLDALRSVNEVDAIAQTPLHKGAWSGATNTVQVLIKNKASVNPVDEYKNTPLHLAAIRGNTDVVQLLLKNGAGANARNDVEQTPLHLAAQEGQTEIVRVLIEDEADVSATDINLQTALHLASASWWGGVDTVEVLLDHGALVDAADDSKQTPLHLAVGKWGRVDTAQILIDHKADVNAADENRETPLHLAAQKMYVDVIQLLVDSGANVNAGDSLKQTPLHITAEEGDIQTLQVLLDSKADVGAVDANRCTPLHLAAKAGRNDNLMLLVKHGDINSKDENGQTPLHLAADYGKNEAVQLLLDHKSDLNAVDDKIRTPLHVSAENGRYETVNVLLKHKADICAKDASMKTPLHLAAECDRDYNEDVVKILLDNNAEVDAFDENKQTPLHRAAFGGRSESVQMLISYKADINFFDDRMRTPLHIATADGRSDIVQVLLHNQAQMNIAGENGQTPLHMAADRGHTDTIKVFMRHKADVNVSDNNQRTPLHLAAYGDRKESVQVLLAKRADVNATDERKQTPLHLAASSGSTETVKVLLKNKADIQAVDDNNMSALEVAQKYSHSETAKVLKQAHADA